MIADRIRTYRRKDGPKLVTGKQTTDKAGIAFERSALMPKGRADRFAAALPGVCLAEVVRDHHAAGTRANHFVRFIRIGTPLTQTAQALSDLRAQRAAEQVDEMDFLPLGESRECFLVVHRYPQPGPDGDETAMYEVSAKECSCPDYEFRCRYARIQCKHIGALLITYPCLSSRPTPAAPLRTPEQRKAWVAANIGNDF